MTTTDSLDARIPNRITQREKQHQNHFNFKAYIAEVCSLKEKTDLFMTVFD